MPYMGLLKQSTAVTKTILMVDASDHLTGKTGLAAGITKYLSKGGSAASATMTTAEVDATNVKGVYSLAFTTAHTDTLGDFQLHLTATGADPADYWWTVVAATTDDLVRSTTPANTLTVDVNHLVAVPATQQVDLNTVKTQSVTCGAGVTVGAYVGNATAALAADASGRVQLQAGTGAGQLDFTSGVVKANLVQILAAALTGTAAQIVAAFTNFFNVAAPTGTLNSLPAAVPGASGGLPTTNGAKLNQTADLTSGQSIACSDKTGFSLSTAGVQAIWDALTSALTTAGSVGKAIVDLCGRIVGTLAAGTHNPQTGDSYARLGAAGAGLTALGDARVGNLDATVSSRLAASGYTAPPAASAIRSEMDSNSSKLANLDATTSSRLAGSNYTAPPSASTIAAAVWASVVGATSTAAQILRAMAAAVAGKLSGAGTTTETFRDLDDTKTVLVATVDASGNRSAITKDLS